MHDDGSDPVESGPATAAADAWLRAVTTGDHGVAWSLVDPDLRLANAQAWIVQTLGRGRDDALAERLATASSTEPAWLACVRSNGEIWRSTHKWWELCGWRANAEPETSGSFVRVALALNLNLNADVAAFHHEMPLQHFIMRRRDEWRIAGIGRYVTFPGWPPTNHPFG